MDYVIVVIFGFACMGYGFMLGRAQRRLDEEETLEMVLTAIEKSAPRIRRILSSEH